MNERERFEPTNEEPSGYALNESERINSGFSDISIINLSEYYFIAKGMRYGKWFILKGINQKYLHNESVIALLRKEFDLLIGMDHPYIRKVVGLEVVPSVGPAIIMDYVEGVTLGKWLEGEHPLSERFRIANEILEALAYIHGKAVVHRDIKPENIIISRIGESVKIIDFGLSDSDSYALFKNPAGTVNYVSEEQRNSSVPNPSNDIYSCGKVFQKLLPEIRFRIVINDCLKDAQNRPQNVSVLKTKLKKAYNKPKLLLLLSIFMVVVIVSSLVLLNKNPEQPKDSLVIETQENSQPIGISDNTEEAQLPEEEREDLIEINSETATQDTKPITDPVVKPDLKPEVKLSSNSDLKPEAKPALPGNKLKQDSLPVKSDEKKTTPKETKATKLSKQESINHFAENGKLALDMLYKKEWEDISSEAKKTGSKIPDNSYPQTLRTLKGSFLRSLEYHINYDKEFNNKYDLKITDLQYIEYELDKHLDKLQQEWKKRISQKK